MKNGEAIWNAAKALGKELSIGIQEEYDGLKKAAEKIKTEYKEGTLTGTVKQQFEKEKATAETVIAAQIENLEKELQKLKEQLEQRNQNVQAEEAAPVVETEAVEAEPEDFVDAAPAVEVPSEESPAENPAEEPPVEAPAAEEPVQE